MRKLCLSTKFAHQEIRWNYGIFRCDICHKFIKLLPHEHCVKSVQIRSFFLVRVFLHSDWIRTDTEYTDHKKLRIWTLFTLCELHVLLSLSLLFNFYSTIKLNEFLLSTEVHSEASQTSKMELFAKSVTSFQPLTVFAKYSILDVWLGSEYASEIIYAIRIIKSLRTISNINPKIRKVIIIKI